MRNSAGDSADAPSEDTPPADANPRNGAGDPSPSGRDGSPTEGDAGEPLVAEIGVEHSDVVLGDSIRAAPSVTVEPCYRTSDDRSPLLVFVVAGGALSEFEAALEADHTVSDVQRIGVADGARAYRVRYATDTLRLTPVFADLGVLVHDSRTDGRRWLFHVRFPSRAAFADFRKFCSSNNATLNLFRLSQGGQSDGGGDFGLTEQQWETLRVAHEMGYFDVPRGTTQEELASELDVSPSAVSQRIRRATNQLLAAAIDSSQFGAQF